MTDTVDLLIIGAGPAGLMAACWATRYKNMRTRIIDQKSGRTRTGHADGLQSRTLEILDSFGLLDPILRQAVGDVEMCYWGVNDKNGNIEREKRLPSQPGYLSEFGQVLLNQGLIEDILIEYLNKNNQIAVGWQKKAEILGLSSETENGDSEEHPLMITVKDLSDSNGKTETIRTRYIVACDGARSWTREQFQVPMETHSEESTWGVIDIAPITNFPDVRQSCAIQSGKNGSIMTAPRENRLLRLYIQLKGDDELEQEARKETEESPKALVRIAERAMNPYHLKYRHCDWWSIYSVAQRLVKHNRIHNRVFLAGDAAHTHSPMAGQGMNISMQDTYNLIWKLGSVITNAANPDILETYESERRPVAQELMQLDTRVLQAYQESGPKGEGIEEIRKEYAGFMTGTRVTYQPSILVAESNKTIRLPGDDKITVGMRLEYFKKQIVNHADGLTTNVIDLLRSTGVWRLLVFPGDLRKQQQAKKLKAFAESPFADRFLNNMIDVVESFLIHSSPRDDIPFFDIPKVFHPFDEMFGWDYGRIYTDYEDSNGKDEPESGTENGGYAVLCRPDQHVAWIGGLDDVRGLEKFFARILA